VKFSVLLAAMSLLIVGCGGQSSSTSQTSMVHHLPSGETGSPPVGVGVRLTRLAELEHRYRAEFRRIEQHKEGYFFRALPPPRPGVAYAPTGITLATGKGRLEQRARHNVEASFYYNRR
jgi:hypothetical protein